MATASKTDPLIGKTYYAARTDRRWGYDAEVVVTKVGRNWITLKNVESGHEFGRVAIGSRTVEGGYHVLYPDKATYEAVTAARRAWQALRDKLYASPPDDMTAAKVHEAAAILGIKLEGD